MKYLLTIILGLTISLYSFSKGGYPLDLSLDSAQAIVNSDPAKSVLILERVLKKTIELNDTENEQRCYLLLGNANNNLKLYDQAIRYFSKASQLSTSFSKKSFYSSKIADKSTNDFSASIEIMKGLAISHEGKEDYKKAKEYILNLDNNKSFKTSQDNQAWIDNAYGRIAFKTGDIEQAKVLFQRVSDNASKISNVEYILEANNYLGELYARENKRSKVKEYLSKSVEAYDEKKSQPNMNDNNNGELNSNSLFFNSSITTQSPQNRIDLQDAQTLIDNNKPEKAIQVLKNSLKESDKSNVLLEKAEIYKKLSSAYEKQGNSEKAFESYRQYVRYNDSLYKQKDEKLRALLLTNSSIAEVNNRINLLEKNKELSVQQIKILEKEKSFQKLVIIALCTIIITVIVSSWLLYKNIRQKKIANQLLALKSLRSQMNPHFIFNALNSVNSFISTNDQKTANKYLSDFSKLMRLVLENSQKDFIPLIEEIEVLKLYLKLEHFRFSNKFDYQFEIDSSINTEQYRIPPMLIQPYIENAVWHGLRYKEDKGSLLVHILLSSNSVDVIIADDGIGRKRSLEYKTKNQKQNESMGLKNIESRLDIINDIYKTSLKVSIEDNSINTDAGTRVKISIPFIIEK